MFIFMIASVCLGNVCFAGAFAGVRTGGYGWIRVS